MFFSTVLCWAMAKLVVLIDFLFNSSIFLIVILTIFKLFNFEIVATFKFLQFGFSFTVKLFSNFKISIILHYGFLQIFCKFKFSTIRLFGFLYTFARLPTYYNSVLGLSSNFFTSFKFHQLVFSLFCKLFHNFQVSLIRLFGLLQTYPQLLNFSNSAFRFL